MGLTISSRFFDLGRCKKLRLGAGPLRFRSGKSLKYCVTAIIDLGQNSDGSIGTPDNRHTNNREYISPNRASTKMRDLDTSQTLSTMAFSKSPILGDAPFTIEDAPGAGRGVFATRVIKAGETVLVANDLLAYTLFREYRGEVCCNCFTYHMGEKLPVRDNIHGLAFCSAACRLVHLQQADDLCLMARAAVEKLIKMKASAAEEQYMGQRPSVDDIAMAWKNAEVQATGIVKARMTTSGIPATKSGLRSTQRAMSTPVSPDTVTFQLSVVLAAYSHRHEPDWWPRAMLLEAEPTPYLSARELDEYVVSYLHLLAVLPEELLPLVTAETMHAIKTRETHNSFGIRSLGDGGSEFFGFGVWPSASYFNHSCAPNLCRRREGRAWVFSAKRDIVPGEQLQISYLSGEDSSGDDVNWRERSVTLRKTWGFDCACGKCVMEKAEEEALLEACVNGGMMKD